jgi:hypothetical protein
MLCSLAFVFALALNGQPSQPPTPSAVTKPCNQGDTQCKGIQPQTHTNLQGSQASPLWVNVYCPGCSKTGSENDTSKPKDSPPPNWRRDPNWWVALFTLLLGFIAIGQATLFLVQLRLMKSSLKDSKTAADAARDAANAARQSAEIATNTERAWLVTNVTFSSNWPDVSGTSRLRDLPM